MRYWNNSTAASRKIWMLEMRELNCLLIVLSRQLFQLKLGMNLGMKLKMNFKKWADVFN